MICKPDANRLWEWMSVFCFPRVHVSVFKSRQHLKSRDLMYKSRFGKILRPDCSGPASLGPWGSVGNLFCFGTHLGFSGIVHVYLPPALLTQAVHESGLHHPRQSLQPLLTSTSSHPPPAHRWTFFPLLRHTAIHAPSCPLNLFLSSCALYFPP